MMMLRLMDRATLPCLQDLIQANFAGRDRLYAAAATLDDRAQKTVCRRLADQLADHAAELQQVVLANAGDPGDCDETYLAAESLFDEVWQGSGEPGVLRTAEDYEREMKQRYDAAIEQTSDREVEGLLRRHRNNIEFGEYVLCCMVRPLQPR
jgi:uncharacterized protein (TIGR02284 family)